MGTCSVQVHVADSAAASGDSLQSHIKYSLRQQLVQAKNSTLNTQLGTRQPPDNTLFVQSHLHPLLHKENWNHRITLYRRWELLLEIMQHI